MWATRKTGAKEETNVSSSVISASSGKLFRVANEIHFMGDIDYESMHELVKLLKEAEADALKNVAACKKAFEMNDNEKLSVDMTIAAKPIMLHITSHGGYIYPALKVVDTIENLKVAVHTVVSGYVAAAGTLLSLVGKKRYMTKNSFMLIHELRSGFWGKFSDAREELGNLEKLMTTLINIITKKSKLCEEKLKEVLTRDRNWDCNECLEQGMIDEII